MRYSFLNSPSGGQIRQILALYKSEGWWVVSRDDEGLVKRIVAGSHCFLVVEEDERLVGMGRAISDGVSDGYIQDVAVEADCRGRGVGREIITRLVNRLNRDGVNWVGLVAERGSHPFYERLGFKVMPDSTPMVRIFMP
jgi:spermidine synthase